jgi:precorrin-2 methylase
MSGHLYGIGVGPGDPELLTIKAAKILGRVDVILAASPPRTTTPWPWTSRGRT